MPCSIRAAARRERYLNLNAHARSYTWKALVRDPVTETHVFQVGGTAPRNPTANSAATAIPISLLHLNGLVLRTTPGYTPHTAVRPSRSPGSKGAHSTAYTASNLHQQKPPPAARVAWQAYLHSPPTCRPLTTALRLPCQELDLNQTLEENGVPDETPEFEDHNVPTDYFIPVLHVYWNDDLTVA